MGRAAQHVSINYIQCHVIWRALSKANILSSIEPSGLSRTDSKRPDGVTLAHGSEADVCANRPPESDQ